MSTIPYKLSELYVKLINVGKLQQAKQVVAESIVYYVIDPTGFKDIPKEHPLFESMAQTINDIRVLSPDDPAYAVVEKLLRPQQVIDRTLQKYNNTHKF